MQNRDTDVRPPLVLERTRYLYAGGKIDPTVEGSPMVGQMYAEFMIPAQRKHPYPIVMIHGGSQTGTNFTGTIAGDEGWAQYFARRGYAVYVIDQVARGRSAYWSPTVFAPLAPAKYQFRRAALRRTRALQVMATGAPAQPIPRLRHARRPVFPGFSGDTVSISRGFRTPAEDQHRGACRAARQDRTGDSPDPFAVRRLWLASRRSASQHGEGDRRHRAERPTDA